MFRPAVTAGRTLLRYSSLRPSLVRPVIPNTTRSLGTATSKRSGFKSTAVKWALAGAIAYWYATSNVFADEPKYPPEELDNTSPDDDRPPSLLPKHSPRPIDSTHGTSEAESNRLASAPDAIAIKGRTPPTSEPDELTTSPKGPEELEEEAAQEGAFNPETGEINWDCPCLGGMAHGPCGEEFKTAFSCFVFSTEDPKGVDCIDKFKGMQTCFQQHPEVYGSELDGDEDEDELDTIDSTDKSVEITTGEAHTSHLGARPSEVEASRDAPTLPARTVQHDSITGAKIDPVAGASKGDGITSAKIDTRPSEAEASRDAPALPARTVQHDSIADAKIDPVAGASKDDGRAASATHREPKPPKLDTPKEQ